MTLTDLSLLIRKAVPFLVLSFIFIFIIYFSIRLAQILITSDATKIAQESNIQPTDVPTNTIFGKIPPLQIQTKGSSNKYTYSLNTKDQQITAPSAINVYKIIDRNTPSVDDSAFSVIAKSCGFNTEKIQYSISTEDQNMAIFETQEYKLSIDRRNLNFTFEHLRIGDEIGRLKSLNIPSDENFIKDTAKNFISTTSPEKVAQLFKGDIKIYYFKFDAENGVILPLSDENKTQAQIVEVDFFRGELPKSKEKTYSPAYAVSSNQITLVFDSSYEKGYKIVKAQIKFFNISEQEIGVYPVIKGTEAFERLKNGKAYITYIDENAQNISITEAFLGHFDSDIYQMYLQPTYIFIGKYTSTDGTEKSFIAHVPAIKDEFIALEQKENKNSEGQDQNQNQNQNQNPSPIQNEIQSVSPTIEPTQEPITQAPTIETQKPTDSQTVVPTQQDSQQENTNNNQ